MKRLYFHREGSSIVGVLELTDEKAIELLLRGWDIRPLQPITIEKENCHDKAHR